MGLLGRAPPEQTPSHHRGTWPSPPAATPPPPHLAPLPPTAASLPGGEPYRPRNGRGLDVGAPVVGEVGWEARRRFGEAGQGGAAAQLRPDGAVSPPPRRVSLRSPIHPQITGGVWLLLGRRVATVFVRLLRLDVTRLWDWGHREIVVSVEEYLGGNCLVYFVGVLYDFSIVRFLPPVATE
jgi:hypothetical protein